MNHGGIVPIADNQEVGHAVLWFRLIMICDPVDSEESIAESRNPTTHPLGKGGLIINLYLRNNRARGWYITGLRPSAKHSETPSSIVLKFRPLNPRR